MTTEPIKDLHNANLRNAVLCYADLRNANLRYANLSYANLSYANLNGANLRNANLSYAVLSRTNCQLILRDDGSGFGVHVDWADDGTHTYRAGCRSGYDIEDCRHHWGNPDHDAPESAARILAACEAFEANIESFR